MKKTLFVTLSAILFSVAAHAQSSRPYADLVVYRLFLKNYVAELHVDSNSKPKKSILRLDNGRKIKFAEEADALNYTCRQGWELVSSYRSHSGETHFILKKK
jgi:hypothetical protein